MKARGIRASGRIRPQALIVSMLCGLLLLLVPAAAQANRLLIIDEDSIDNGNAPNFFSAQNVNDDIAEIGLRTQLRFFQNNIGQEITLYTGQVGDEGWFAPKVIPPSWKAAGPTSYGLGNYLVAGPGLGSPDANGNRETLLDKVPKLTPLRATGLKMFVGRRVCAVVYDSNITINYDPLNGSLKGANLGTVAFKVLSVEQLTGFSSGTLPKVRIVIKDARRFCSDPVGLVSGIPEPTSSSEPYDVNP
jgi:hypothetical protein